MTTYTVKVRSLYPILGAKNKTATFCNREDAGKQYQAWVKWLDAEPDSDNSDIINMRAVSKDAGYEVTLTQELSTIQDIDYDTRS